MKIHNVIIYRDFAKPENAGYKSDSVSSSQQYTSEEIARYYNRLELD